MIYNAKTYGEEDLERRLSLPSYPSSPSLLLGPAAGLADPADLADLVVLVALEDLLLVLCVEKWLHKT